MLKVKDFANLVDVSPFLGSYYRQILRASEWSPCNHCAYSIHQPYQWFIPTKQTFWLEVLEAHLLWVEVQNIKKYSVLFFRAYQISALQSTMWRMLYPLIYDLGRMGDVSYMTQIYKIVLTNDLKTTRKRLLRGCTLRCVKRLSSKTQGTGRLFRWIPIEQS